MPTLDEKRATEVRPGNTQDYELFKRMEQLCEGFPRNTVASVALNLMLHAIRNDKTTWTKAEAAVDEMVGKGKQTLRNQYDPLGKRKPYVHGPQIIRATLADFRFDPIAKIKGRQ